MKDTKAEESGSRLRNVGNWLSKRSVLSIRKNGCDWPMSGSGSRGRRKRGSCVIASISDF
jgi:hypothetical protein